MYNLFQISIQYYQSYFKVSVHNLFSLYNLDRIN